MDSSIRPPSTDPIPLAPKRRQRLVLALLGLVLLAGAGLRVWYASGQLHINRFEDERYSLRNVRKIVGTWDFEPASGYYPSPVFNLPQAVALVASQRLAEATDTPALRTYAEGGVMLPAAFLLTRLYQTVCGVLTVWLAFLVGRRLGTPRSGLLAAAVLAFMPWMIHASGYNKPDALLVMAVLLSFHAALRALETVPWPTADADRPSFSMRTTILRWAWAGIAIALAMSAKLTGGLAAVPLTLGALAAPGDRLCRLRRAGLLALAGVVSALTFIAANPYWPAYLHFLRGLQTDYAKRTDASQWEIPWRVLAMHFEGFFFGPVLGGLALLGVVACAAFAVHRLRTRGRGGLGLLLLVVFPLVYIAAYAAQTPYFKPNNFLPLIPLSAVALGVVLDAGLRASARRVGDPRIDSAGGVLAGILLLATIVPAGWNYVHNSRVPTTFDLAWRQLDERLQPAAGHLVFTESWQAPPVPWDGARPLHNRLSAVTPVDDPRALPDEVLAHAAAVVLRTGSGPLPAASVADRWSRVESWRIEPRFGRLRGPELEIVLHPARRLDPVDAPEVTACGPRCLEAALPALEAGEVVSFFLFLPQRLVPGDMDAVLELGPRTEPLHWVSRQGKGHLFVSPRLPAPPGVEMPGVEMPGVEIVRLRTAVDLTADGTLPSPEGVALEVHRWRPER
ncbi:MAG: glycosyltransferase family 39 protein [Acidobacteriota bacterium]